MGMPAKEQRSGISAPFTPYFLFVGKFPRVPGHEVIGGFRHIVGDVLGQVKDGRFIAPRAEPKKAAEGVPLSPEGNGLLGQGVLHVVDKVHVGVHELGHVLDLVAEVENPVHGGNVHIADGFPHLVPIHVRHHFYLFL
jgi:hypothetical protein